MTHDLSVERWRDTAESDNPAGPLFFGTHAEADIVRLSDGPTLACGSICTGSSTGLCC
jgi:Family of unknown function (DUF6229)